MEVIEQVRHVTLRAPVAASRAAVGSGWLLVVCKLAYRALARAALAFVLAGMLSRRDSAVAHLRTQLGPAVSEPAKVA
jgi:hypothetical protein